MITAAYLTRRTWRRRKIRILHNHLMTRQLHAIQGTRAALFNNFFQTTSANKADYAKLIARPNVAA